MAPLLMTPRTARRGQGILLLGNLSLFLAYPMTTQVQQPADCFRRTAFMPTREEKL